MIYASITLITLIWLACIKFTLTHIKAALLIDMSGSRKLFYILFAPALVTLVLCMKAIDGRQS